MSSLPPRPLALALTALFALGTMSLSGCKSNPVRTPDHWEPNRQTKDHVTSFYLVFPPKDKSLWKMPNQTLPVGTPVRFIQTKRGYHQVQLQSLELGWVPKGTLKGYR